VKGLSWAALGVLVWLTSCAREIDDVGTAEKGDGSISGGGHSNGGSSKNMDGGKFGNSTGPQTVVDAAPDPAPDAFFINDPAPPVCAEDGSMQEPMTPGGTAACPDDKNREGCPCPKPGAEAACWPGKRLNRHHGICKDGMTTCADTVEFGLQWGPCKGYVLPDEGALAGPDACRCFSSGQWTLSNIAPCIGPDNSYLYWSRVNADGTLDCGTASNMRPTPSGSWSEGTLNVDCAGQFKLCYTIKAGSVSNPKPDDCVVMQTCVDTWYEKAGTDQKLDDLPAWVSNSSASACAAQFAINGGYGEMSVIGKSIECDAVDDGKGNPYVFHRTDYCKPTCRMTPDTPECRACQTGGSGMFGN
jgi:hypothetical protein